MRLVPAQLFSLYGLVSGSWCFCLEFPCTWKCGKGAASGKNLCRNDCLYRTACVLYRRGLCDQPDARGWTRGLDYIIVLGAQVRKDGPSPVLKYRLDKAVEYLNENPDTVCIVSGGQGSNEPWTEAEGMAQYLQEKGIDTARILTEDQSQTTEQNITNSKMLMKEGASVGIVTNNFHVFRALQIAKSTDFLMSVELRRIPHQNICRTICCGNFLRR